MGHQLPGHLVGECHRYDFEGSRQELREPGISHGSPWRAARRNARRRQECAARAVTLLAEETASTQVGLAERLFG